jgi:hypothetical protein
VGEGGGGVVVVVLLALSPVLPIAEA